MTLLQRQFCARLSRLAVVVALGFAAALASRFALAESAPTARMAAPCDFGCKVRIHACDARKPTRCFSDDLYPECTGLCAFMMMGIEAEWQSKHPDALFKSAECVRPDDNLL